MSSYGSWYSVDFSAMDKVTYPKYNECAIDEYTVIEDSYNSPTLVLTDKECINYASLS
jgi:hypothetical protein